MSPAAGIVIGESREGRPILGYRLGTGRRLVSLVAGAHADEPTGPRLLRRWVDRLSVPGQDAPTGRLLEDFAFLVVPDVNPDGAARNAGWVAETPTLGAYLAMAVREPPGEDVEFNYPQDAQDRDTRPENLAVADWLRAEVGRHGGPITLHASLHGMGIAEGVWYLVCREWADRVVASGMTDRLARLARTEGLGLHDMDRGGEKGFARFAPGFSTTPRSEAMRAFFLERGDARTAALFRPSSMELARSLGGNPLCLVSEVPLFLVGRRGGRPGEAYERAREELSSLRGTESSVEALAGFAARHALRWVPWERQMRIQEAFVMEGLELVRGAAPIG